MVLSVSIMTDRFKTERSVLKYVFFTDAYIFFLLGQTHN